MTRPTPGAPGGPARPTYPGRVPGPSRPAAGPGRARALALTAVAWTAVAVCVVLGWWQWRSGNVVVSAPPAQQPVVAVEEVVAAGAPDGRGVLVQDEVGRRVVVSGTFDPAVDLRVPSRLVDDAVGSWVVGLVRSSAPDGSERGTAVVRGFVPEGAQAPPLPAGPVEVTGVVQPPEGSDTVPATRALGPGEVRVVSAADLVNRVDYPVANAYVTDTSPQAGLVAVPPPDPGQATRRLDLRNLAYAAQWWVFAGFAVLLWTRFLRDDRRDREALRAAAEPAGPAGPADPTDPTDPRPGGRDMSTAR